MLASTTINIPILLALSNSEDWLLITCFSALSVLFAQAFLAPASAIIAHSAQGPEQVSLFAFYRIFINLGSIVAPAAVSLIGVEHFSTLFIVSACGNTIVIGLLYLLPRSTTSSTDSYLIESEEKDESAIKNHVTLNESSLESTPPNNRSLLWILLLSMAITMAIYAQHQGAIPLELNTRENGERIFATLLILNPVVVILVEYPLSHLTKRLHWSTALSIGVAIMGIGISLTGALESIFFAYLGWLLFSIGECIFAPMSNVAVAKLSTKSNTSKYQGFLASFQSAGMTLGPAVGTALYFASPEALWVSMIALSLAIPITIFTGTHRYKTNSANN